MPTYDYKCRSCGLIFELFQNITAEPVAVCAQCGREAKRLISSGAGVIFKGTGFYETDYKRKSGNGKDDPKTVSCPSGGDCKSSCPAK
jgi:putative FmdB family regulatory protein